MRIDNTLEGVRFDNVPIGDCFWSWKELCIKVEVSEISDKCYAISLENGREVHLSKESPVILEPRAKIVFDKG